MLEPTIYIIDDDQPTVDLILEYAELLGFQAKGYTAATKFFDEIKSFVEGSFIVLDLNMPDMDGIEVMRHMVKTGQCLPFILVSGYDSGVLHSAEQLAKAYSLDIIATITKPFEFKIFKDILYLRGVLQKHPKSTVQEISPAELSIDVFELELAIRQDQLVLHYQPQIDIHSGVVTGVKARVHWQHPIYGLISPELFISLAENNGLIAEMTAKIIKQAAEQTVLWKSQNIEMRVSVNISAENITSLSMPEQLSRILEQRSLDPSMLTIEVTERTLMGELVTSLDILTRLRMKGVGLSIGDFGTGHSSLSLLHRMPFTELKIDQSFVSNMLQDEEAQGIVKTCIKLGHELSMTVVAEGVENRQTLDLLNEMNCDIAQGSFISDFMSTEDLIIWMRKKQHLKEVFLVQK